MARKEGRSLKLSAELESELEGLVGTYLGSNRSEVITFILKEWLLAKAEYLIKIRKSGV